MKAILQDVKFFIYFMFLFLIFNPFMVNDPAWGGASTTDIVGQTDFGSNRLVMFWDTRDRDTYFQIANISTSLVTVHVQILDVLSSVGCVELNFDDTFTPLDTHIYDVENLETNAGPGLEPFDIGDLPSGSYGFIVVSLRSGDPNSLIGVFSIFDENGYQYRTNAVTPNDSNAEMTNDMVINFSAANGNAFSDLVGITFLSLSQTDVYASPGVATTFGSDNQDEILIYDEVESSTICANTSFSCDITQLDKAIDNSLPNSKGEVNKICSTSILNNNDTGWLNLPFSQFVCDDPIVGTAEGICLFDPFFVGFIGLNNGDRTGSMDSWWSTGGNQ